MKKETVKSEVTLADKMALHKISVITSKSNKSGAMIIYLDGKKISYVNARNLYSNYCVNPELYGRVYVWAVACDEEKTIERIKAAIAKIENVEDDGSNDEPDEEEILAVEVENVEYEDDEDLADEYWIVAEVENTLLEIEGYVYSFNYAESDKLFDEIFKFFPYAQWFLKKEIPDEDKRNTYNFLTTFKGVLTKNAFEEFKKIFKDIPSERYSISYEEVEGDDTPPEDDTNPENDTPNDNSDVEGNEEPVDIVTIRRQACAKLEAVKAECNALEKEQDKLISYRRRCKDKAKIAAYDAKLAEIDTKIRAKGAEFLKANDYRNEVMKPTAGELETLKKIAEARQAEQIASGIKYVAKVYVFPHGIEGEGMVCYPKDCKTLEEVESWINGDDIPVYTGGIYDAGWIVEDLDGRHIADHHTGLEHLKENKAAIAEVAKEIIVDYIELPNGKTRKHFCKCGICKVDGLEKFYLPITKAEAETTLAKYGWALNEYEKAYKAMIEKEKIDYCNGYNGVNPAAFDIATQAEIDNAMHGKSITLNVPKNIAKALVEKLKVEIKTLSSIYCVPADNYSVFDVNNKAMLNFENAPEVSKEDTDAVLIELCEKAKKFFSGDTVESDFTQGEKKFLECEEKFLSVFNSFNEKVQKALESGYISMETYIALIGEYGNARKELQDLRDDINGAWYISPSDVQYKLKERKEIIYDLDCDFCHFKGILQREFVNQNPYAVINEEDNFNYCICNEPPKVETSNIEKFEVGGVYRAMQDCELYGIFKVVSIVTDNHGFNTVTFEDVQHNTFKYPVYNVPSGYVGKYYEQAEVHLEKDENGDYIFYKGEEDLSNSEYRNSQYLICNCYKVKENTGEFLTEEFFSALPNDENATKNQGNILPPLEVWQSILDKSLAEIKAIMKVPA